MDVDTGDEHHLELRLSDGDSEEADAANGKAKFTDDGEEKLQDTNRLSTLATSKVSLS